jgi:hypothetical protein
VCARTARGQSPAGPSCRGCTRIKEEEEEEDDYWTEALCCVAPPPPPTRTPRRREAAPPRGIDGRPLVGAVPPCLATPVVFAEPFLFVGRKSGGGGDATPRPSEPRPVRRLFASCCRRDEPTGQMYTETRKETQQAELRWLLFSVPSLLLLSSSAWCARVVCVQNGVIRRRSS